MPPEKKKVPTDQPDLGGPSASKTFFVLFLFLDWGKSQILSLCQRFKGVCGFQIELPSMPIHLNITLPLWKTWDKSYTEEVLMPNEVGLGDRGKQNKTKQNKND